MRSSTVLVRLAVEVPAEVSALSLPALARNHLYRYPKLTAADLDKPLLANCLWSALNFFELQGGR